MREKLYHGLDQIARRIGVSKPVVRRMIRSGKIRAFKLDKSDKAPWCSIESELCDDIKNLPSKACQ